MRTTLPLLVATLCAAECERTPREDFGSRSPTPAVTAISAPSASAAAVRCVSPTPAQPPAAVPLGPARDCPPDPESPQGAGDSAAVVRVAFPEAGGVAVQAELVRSQHDTMRGLMYRTSLAPNRGMLFDLRVREDHQFWMHNTCIPLDLLYVDDDGLVVGIVENAPTLNDAPRGVGCASVYVLEVNAGWARQHGVRAGQHMTIPSDPERR